MNDRFRFRAWDKDIKRYWEDGNFDLRRAREDESLIIEQCTGLKDKNGLLIYEGDIVKTENNSIYKCVFEMNYGYGINSPGFMLTNEFGHAQSFDDDIEVVGNIHENPELLEDK